MSEQIVVEVTVDVTELVQQLDKIQKEMIELNKLLNQILDKQNRQVTTV